LALLCFDCGC